jgi:hypothetical protein
MALGDGIRRNIAHVDPAERALLRDAFVELNQRFFPGTRTDSPRGGRWVEGSRAPLTDRGTDRSAQFSQFTQSTPGPNPGESRYVMVKVKRLLAALAATAAVLALAASPAAAVKFGAPDTADAYPWVGYMVSFDAGGQPLGACSGSLLSDELFLTAAHCVSDPFAGPEQQPAEVRIWFTNEEIKFDPQFIVNFEALMADPDADVQLCAGVTAAPCGGYDAVGEPRAHPNWGSSAFPQTSDVGVATNLVWTSEPPRTFGKLAPAGLLDELSYKQGKGNVEFTVAGFGLQSIRPVLSDITQRMIGTVSLVNLRSRLSGGWNLQLSGNPGQGHGGSGGTCFGDSGGPVIYDDALLGQVIVAVNSFGMNRNCQGPSFAYRVDTRYAQDFIPTG